MIEPLYGPDGDVAGHRLGYDGDGCPVLEGPDDGPDDRPLVPDDSPADEADLPLWPSPADERWWAERTREAEPWYLPLLPLLPLLPDAALAPA